MMSYPNKSQANGGTGVPFFTKPEAGLDTLSPAIKKAMNQANCCKCNIWAFHCEYGDQTDAANWQRVATATGCTVWVPTRKTMMG